MATEEPRPPAEEIPLAATPPATTTVVGYPISWGFSLPPAPPGSGLPAVLHPDRGRETLRGLGRLRLATAVALVASCLTTGVGVLALYLFLNPEVAPGILSLPPALGLMLVAFLVQLLAVAFGWSAFEDIGDAAPSISEPHEDAARGAVHVVYLAAAAWIIGGLAGLAVFGAYFSGGLGSFPFGEIPRAAVLSITISFALTGIAVNALTAYAMQGVFGRLLTEKGRQLRPLFYRLALGGTLISAGVSIYCHLVLASVDLYGLVGVISVASLSVYLAQIREAERGVAAMAAARTADPDSLAPQEGFPQGAQG